MKQQIIQLILAISVVLLGISSMLNTYNDGKTREILNAQGELLQGIVENQGDFVKVLENWSDRIPVKK